MKTHGTSGMHLILQETKKNTRCKSMKVKYFYKNTSQLHYSKEANRGLDADSGNKPSRHFSQDIFLKWREKKTVNTEHAVHDILTILYFCSWISREKLHYPTTTRHIHWHCSARIFLATGKKKSNPTNHRVGFYLCEVHLSFLWLFLSWNLI